MVKVRFQKYRILTLTQNECSQILPPQRSGKKPKKKRPFSKGEGVQMQKKYCEHFFPPLRPLKISGPLFAMKVMGQPHKKVCKLNFHWKICGNFFQAPSLQSSNLLRSPFASALPPPRVCEWSLSGNGAPLNKYKSIIKISSQWYNTTLHHCVQWGAVKPNISTTARTNYKGLVLFVIFQISFHKTWHIPIHTKREPFLSIEYFTHFLCMANVIDWKIMPSRNKDLRGNQ